MMLFWFITSREFMSLGRKGNFWTIVSDLVSKNDMTPGDPIANKFSLNFFIFAGSYVIKTSLFRPVTKQYLKIFLLPPNHNIFLAPMSKEVIISSDGICKFYSKDRD